MNNCINLKQKLNHKLVCKRTNKEIDIKQCNNCIYKEYKKCTKFKNNCAKGAIKNTKMHNQSAKLRKLERNRFSLFTDDYNHCIICGSTYQLTWHEIFDDRNRPNSLRFGLCIRICLSCHKTLQNDKNFNEIWHKKGQAMFVKTYPDLDFAKMFRKNYL